MLSTSDLPFGGPEEDLQELQFIRLTDRNTGVFLKGQDRATAGFGSASDPFKTLSRLSQGSVPAPSRVPSSGGTETEEDCKNEEGTALNKRYGPTEDSADLLLKLY